MFDRLEISVPKSVVLCSSWGPRVAYAPVAIGIWSDPVRGAGASNACTGSRFAKTLNLQHLHYPYDFVE